MKVSVALNLLYYIIVLLPALLTLKYFLALIYNIRQHRGDWKNSLWGVIWGVLSIASYSVTVFFINKAIGVSDFSIISRLFYPIVVVLFSLIYSVGIEARDQYTESKITLLIVMPALTAFMFLIDKIF